MLDAAFDIWAPGIWAEASSPGGGVPLPLLVFPPLCTGQFGWYRNPSATPSDKIFAFLSIIPSVLYISIRSGPGSVLSLFLSILCESDVQPQVINHNIIVALHHEALIHMRNLIGYD